jgi:hypothetical protein
MGSRRLRFGIDLAGVLLALAVLVSVWVPVWTHYWVATPSFGLDDIQQARTEGIDPALAAGKGDAYLLNSSWGSKSELIAAADAILGGRLRLPGFPEQYLGFPFDPDSLEIGASEFQLQIAALAVPRTLLDAFEVGGNPAYLEAAAQVISAYAEHDAATWIPRGLQWNDHAIAGRLIVLTRFWWLYRNHELFQPDVAGRALALAARSGSMLAKEGHFTFATNHGIMQNLALWHLVMAFPWLPDAASHRDLALERLTDQMRFYISREGVVLEHSPGYHAAGVALIDLAARYAGILEIDVPSSWEQKRHGGHVFLNRLLRPDGSLPRMGDTRGDEAVSLGLERPVGTAFENSAQDGVFLYPESGYAIVRAIQNRDASRAEQLVTTWADFPGHGHKHADELSLLFWAGDQVWWTSAGYWPYSHDGRALAEGWGGSNAPHLFGEAAGSARRAKLVYSSQDASLPALDLLRTADSGYRVHRQIVGIDEGAWLVLDSHQNVQSGGAGSTWTVASDVVLSDSDDNGCYRLKAGSGNSLSACFGGSDGVSIRAIRGSTNPFGGWVVEKGRVLASSAVRIENETDDFWTAVVWRLDDGATAESDAGNPSFSMVDWQGPNRWSLRISGGASGATLVRADRSISIGDTNGVDSLGRVSLDATPDVDQELLALHQAFQDAKAKYPRVRNMLLPYREKMSMALAAVLFLQEAVLLLIGLRFVKTQRMLRLLSIIAWSGGAVWLHAWYFKL